jgi:hypothetical protein
VSGLRVADVDFMRGVVHPVQHYGGAPLKTDGSDQPIPIPRELALMVAASVDRFGGDHMVTNGTGQPVRPQTVERGGARAPEPIYTGGTEERLAMILYTSGSTGTPKGALFTERMLAGLWTAAIGSGSETPVFNVNIILGVGTRKLRRLFDKPAGQSAGRVGCRKLL